MSLWLQRILHCLPALMNTDSVVDMVAKAMGVMAFCALLGWLLNFTLSSLLWGMSP